MSGGAANSNTFGARPGPRQQRPAGGGRCRPGCPLDRVRHRRAATPTRPPGGRRAGLHRRRTSARTPPAPPCAPACRPHRRGFGRGRADPVVNTLLAAFLGFEAAKSCSTASAASIEAARAHIADFVRIGREARRRGSAPASSSVPPSMRRKFGLTVEQVTAALQHARAASEVRIGEGRERRERRGDRRAVTQNVRAGNLAAADKASFDAADRRRRRSRCARPDRQAPGRSRDTSRPSTSPASSSARISSVSCAAAST